MATHEATHFPLSDFSPFYVCGVIRIIIVLSSILNGSLVEIQGPDCWKACCVGCCLAYVSYSSFQNNGRLILPILPILASEETEKLMDPDDSEPFFFGKRGFGRDLPYSFFVNKK